ncbi:hypothetical protein N7457_005844 [Penicillium paradoxum]|uniref:uncharacterized protein n=1 Tax=Penicillium paradoxum TaxID=176176 RepID=UPI002546C99D|nr:uncharacterized protein N7457_005844 [Penicillium paradoxum]KAJ5780684.1 hypothetical protein N7457_005844 [Penicillium paradoxum]
MEKYPIGTRAESERLVREWGFRDVFTWTDGRWGSSLITLGTVAGFALHSYLHIIRISCADTSSNHHYAPHSHRGLTTHLIRRGCLTITYPEDHALYHGEVKKETFGVGERVDVPAGKVHEVWIGADGCEYVIGE